MNQEEILDVLASGFVENYKATKRTYKMGYKYRFIVPIDSALKHHSGWSGVKWETCKKETTNAQLVLLYKILSGAFMWKL